MKNENIDIRRQRAVRTVFSQLHVAKIGGGYRWKTALSHAYINNAQEYRTEFHILANKWFNIKNIIPKHSKQEEINGETEEINDFKSLTNRGNMKNARNNNNNRTAANQTRTTKHPIQRLRKP